MQNMKFKNFRKGMAVLLAASMIAGTAVTNYTALPVRAAESQLSGIASVTVDSKDNSIVWVTFSNGYKGKLTFLDDNIFRYNVDPSGEFSNYAAVRAGYPDTAKIQQYPDSSENYQHPEATVESADGVYTIKAGDVKIQFSADAKMKIYSSDKLVMEETEALTFNGSQTIQTLKKHDTTNYSTSIGENFYGGGTQNGRFVHTGETINIQNESTWTDGGVSSPNPFYYTTNGYGVLRNTYSDGSYDFGETAEGTVTTTHNENEFDAYYFVSDAENGSSVTQELLQGYYKVTGNPVLLPEYGFYLGHLNAYNRDAWSSEAAEGFGTWTIKGTSSASGTEADKVRYEAGGTGYTIKAGQTAETLNGTGPTLYTDNVPEGVTYSKEFSAQGILDEYLSYDIPFGFFLPNDGYGAGYGQNGYNMTGGVNADGSSSKERLAAVAANVANLKTFVDYAKSKGIATGLWTQSNLTPDSKSDTYWHVLRDFQAEVEAGVTTLKTDVAWVGLGYSFQLSGVKQAYDIVTTTSESRPNIISLDGWAGSQRFNSVWTGDQYGGSWEYIRFHIPTFIGQSLSGNPNIGSDMDGIWGGSSVIATRDYQWKSFAPQMLDMDGWGSYSKMPYAHGDPYTGVSRMYLKLKAQMMPYIYTNAYAAANIDTGNGDQGLPMMRAMHLAYPEDAYAYSENNQYQYMWGDSLLVAPLYQDTNADEVGNDIRNGIYLPDEDQIWIDYFTGEQYRGGIILNNFDAPIWKLPLFVKNGAIIPMYAEHNTALGDTEVSVDKTQRIIQFWPSEEDTSYTAIEDDGSFVKNTQDSSDTEYGVINEISYGSNVKTTYTSKNNKGTVTLTASAGTGTYTGYDSQKDTTFVVNLSQKPSKLTASNGTSTLKEVAVDSKEAFDAATAEAGTFVTFYDESPEIETYASEAETEIAALVKDVKVAPKLYVKFATVDASENAQTLTIEGYVNDGNLGDNKLNEKLAAPSLTEDEDAKTPTSITVEWEAVADATSYEILVDGMVQSAGNATSFTHMDLDYKSAHTYQIRSRNAEGYSAWSKVVTYESADDPYLNTPEPEEITWSGAIWGSHGPELAFDKEFQTGDGGFHSNNGGINENLTVDYGNAYIFDKIEYYPRTDAGNGTVTEMVVETSLDGVHWVQHGESVKEDGTRYFALEANADMKTLDLSNTAAGTESIGARYIRFRALASVGTFFSASEIKPYAVEEGAGSVKKPFAVGNISTMGTNEMNTKNFEAIFKKESSAHGCYLNDTWKGEVQVLYGDINFNGISDVYDYAFHAFKADGGTKKTGSVSGKVSLVPSAETIAAGETFTVEVTAENVKNLNAYGTIVSYNADKVEYVSSSYGTMTADMYTNGMTGNWVQDGWAYVNHNAVNMGDKALVSGSGVLSTITFKAKTDITLNDVTDRTADDFVMDLSTVTIMGPDYSYIDVDRNAEAEPDTSISYGFDDFDITFTNKHLTTDDGTNKNLLIMYQDQYGDAYGVGRVMNGILDEDFPMELVWHTQNEADVNEKAELPLTMHFALKEANYVDHVKVYNRVNGTTSNNGYLTKATVTLVYEDDTTTAKTLSIGTATEMPCYEFDFSDASVKKVKEVQVLFADATTSCSNGRKDMLTISEIEITGNLPAEAEDIPAASMTMTAGDSQEGQGPELARDDNTGTHWHSSWFNVTTYDNIWIQAALDKTYEISEFRYLPRQDGGTNGMITKYQILTSMDGENWTSAGTGDWSWTSDEDRSEKVVTFETPIIAKYVRLQAVAAKTNNADGYVFASAAEINLKGVAATSECAHTTTELKDVKEATCTEAGYTGDLVCSKCQATIQEGTTIPAKGHDWSAWEVVEAATTEKEGLQKRHCQTAGCNAEETEVIKKVISFSDVQSETSFYYNPVYWAAEKGITTGRADGTFDPKGNVTRGEMVTFLWRLAGCPEVSLDNLKFTDVGTSSFYAEAIAWAVSEGIAEGTSKTTFEPKAEVTRAQAVTFLWRYAGAPTAAGGKEFKDVPSTKFFYQAVAWASANEVTTGDTSGNFTPYENCNRGSAVTFIYRTSSLLNK